jgi:hypothetical protein
MYVARWILAAIVLLAVVAIAWVERERRRLAAALAAWAVPLAPQCVTDLSNVSCAALAAPLGPPPSWATAPAPGAILTGDVANAAAYATALVAQTSSFTLGYTPAFAIGGVSPALVSAPATDPAPFGAVWAAPGWVVVAFRGTASAADLLADARYGLAEPATALGRDLASVVGAGAAADCGTSAGNSNGGCGRFGLPGGDSPTVHAGFAETYSELRQALLHAVAASPASAPVFVAGHSLGAALAFFAAGDIAATAPGRAVRVVGVAPPRSGNYAWTEWLAARPGLRALSVVNSADLVPSVPWSFMPTLSGPTAAFAHVEPVAAFTALWPDAISCHQPAAYAGGLAAGAVALPAVAHGPSWAPPARPPSIDQQLF